MKNILILIVCLLSLNAFSQSVEVDVISAEYNVADHLQNKSLCLTVVRIPATGDLVGVVEGIEDCFYARTAKKSLNHRIILNFDDLRQFSVAPLKEHLQSLDTQLEFLFSEGE